ncbi:MAG: hypothetical protein JRJ54_10340 [Deltaproteobacteria bacterium]|nr:hypothetical protein [Deltaproteobacteria bacterium]
MGGATLLSRILGFVRDAVIAWMFGAGPGADAFFVAFRIPNLLRRLLAEGSLSIAFIPVFTDVMTRQGRAEAFKLVRSAFRILVLVLAVVSALGVLFSPFIVKGIAPGFARLPEKMALTTDLTRIVFPYIFFVGILALFMGVLNALGHFAAPALAPAALNLAVIAAVFFLCPVMAEPVQGLAVGVRLGGGKRGSAFSGKRPCGIRTSTAWGGSCSPPSSGRPCIRSTSWSAPFWRLCSRKGAYLFCTTRTASSSSPWGFLPSPPPPRRCRAFPGRRPSGISRA